MEVAGRSRRRFIPRKTPGYSMVLIDDIGSFPLPEGVTRESFNRAYPAAQEAFAARRRLEEVPELEPFLRAVESSLLAKLDTQLDIVTYPQHYDMHTQFMHPIEKHQREPYLIDERYAVIPEVYVAERVAKLRYEETGERVRLRVCVTGPVELYLKTPFGFSVYEEVLLNLAESVRAFLRNSILDRKHIRTEVVSIDEPSLGFVDLLNVEREGIIKALERCIRGVDAEVQVHLHTLKAAEYPLEAEGVSTITAEFASAPENIELITREELEAADRYLRGGVASTSIDRKLGELAQRGIRNPTPEQLADPEESIARLYLKLRERFGDRLRFAGPDCGLGSWPSQEAARLVLERCVRAVRGAESSSA